jgi:hypothetical protein
MRLLAKIEILCTGLSRKIWQKLIIPDNAGKPDSHISQEITRL